MSIEKAREHLRRKGYADRIIETEESTATVQLAAEALGTTPGEIAKTLSFLVGDEAVLIIVEGMGRVDNRKFKDTFHTKAKMIPGDRVEELTGHAPGGVCPFAVKEGVKIYLDESLKRHKEVYPAAGNDYSGVRLSLDELAYCADALGWVDVCKPFEDEQTE